MQETNQTPAVKKDKKTPFLIICTGICIVLLLVILNRLSGSIDIVSESAGTEFHNQYNSTKEEVYDRFYQNAFDNAEAQHHISNDVEIVIDSIKEEAKLEVYEAADTEYVIYKYEDYGFECWYEISGTCTYFVDLEKSEFLVDQARKTVTIKIPKPEKKYNIGTPQALLYDDDTCTIPLIGIELNNGSAKKGLENVRDAESKGREKIMDYFEGAGTLNAKAEETAKSVLKDLVEWVNPDVEDLKVEIKFFDEED